MPSELTSARLLCVHRSHCADWKPSPQPLIQLYTCCSPSQSAACLPFCPSHLLCISGVHTGNTWVVLDNSGQTEETEGWMGLPSPFSLYSALDRHTACHSSKGLVPDRQPQRQRQSPCKPICRWSFWLGCPSLPHWLGSSTCRFLAWACILLWKPLPPCFLSNFFCIP